MKKRNVLQFICPTGMYGAERWVLALVNNLDDDEVGSKIALTQESEALSEVVSYFRKSCENLSVLKMTSRFSFSAIRSLCQLIRNQEIDVIHTHGYKSDIMGLIAARITGIKIVSTPHGFGTSRDIKLRLYIFIGKLSFWFFDAVAPLSKQLEDEVARAWVPKKKIIFIRNAVDLKEVEKYRIDSGSIKGSGKQKIGYVGQIIERKKIDHLLEIFNKLWLKNNDLELEIIGDGDCREAMEVYAQALPASSNIHFLGFRDDRLEYMRHFDLFVMTSSDEGMPRCLMESVAMGIPVAAYNIAGVDQMVLHGESGLLAEFGDKDSLAGYMERLLSDDSFAGRMADRGRQHIYENYSGRRMAEEYTRLYSTLVPEEG